jgi:hypothetical protein
MHQLGDVLCIGIVGFWIFIEAVDNETAERGTFLSKKDEMLSDDRVETDGEYYVLNEVVAVVEALLLEEFSLGVVGFDGECMVGTDGVLDLPLELDLFLLLLLYQQELFLQLPLQPPQLLPSLALPLSHLLYIGISKQTYPSIKQPPSLDKLEKQVQLL